MLYPVMTHDDSPLLHELRTTRTRDSVNHAERSQSVRIAGGPPPAAGPNTQHPTSTPTLVNPIRRKSDKY